MTGAFRVILGVPRLSVPLVEALLRSGRLLVIIDGLSERTEITRRAFNPGRPDFPIMRLIVTSRDGNRGSMGAVLETLTLPPEALYSFIYRYLSEMVNGSSSQHPDEADLLESCAKLKRLLRETPTTPLLASMWAEEVALDGTLAADRIRSIAELIDSYVDRLLSPVASGDAVRLDNLRVDLTAIAVRELGDSLTPGWLTRAQVLEALRDEAAESPEQRIHVLLESRMLEADSRNAELIRVPLDTIAEHMVARAKTEALARMHPNGGPFWLISRRADGHLASLKRYAHVLTIAPTAEPSRTPFVAGLRKNGTEPAATTCPT